MTKTTFTFTHPSGQNPVATRTTQTKAYTHVVWVSSEAIKRGEHERPFQPGVWRWSESIDAAMSYAASLRNKGYGVQVFAVDNPQSEPAEPEPAPEPEPEAIARAISDAMDQADLSRHVPQPEPEPEPQPELDWRQGFGFGRRVHAVVARGATHGPARCGRVVSIGGKAWSATPAEVRCATCAHQADLTS